MWHTCMTINDLMANMGGGIPFKVMNGIMKDLVLVEESEK